MNQVIQLLAAMAFFASATAWAFEWDTQSPALEAAAEHGDPKAQTLLAVRYEHAEGVKKDPQEAIRLYCLAAKQGYAEAQFNLGWMYANGRGVQHDDGVAGALFAMAADQGHEHAIKLLRYMRPQPDTRMPSCMTTETPHPLLTVETARTRDEAEDDTSGPDEIGDSEIKKLVHTLAPAFGVDPRFALAIISVESAFNPAAVSPKNAQGLMQLIPETAARFGVTRVFDPVENIKGGLVYLRWLLAFFQGNVSLVVAAYNAGERAVEKYRGIPPYLETRNYVRKVTGIYREAMHPFQPGIVNPSPLMGRMRVGQGIEAQPNKGNYSIRIDADRGP